MADAPPEYYWCLRHERVESTDRCKANVLMGPYPTREQAENYAAIAQQREDAWEEEDERWDNP